MATGGLWDDQEQAPQQSSGGLWDDEQPATLAPEQQPAEPTGPAPEGILPTMLRAAVPKIIPGLMGLGGAVAGGAAGAFGGPAAPVTIPLGAVAGGIAAESQGGKVNKWVASKLFAPDTIAEYNAQLEANAKAHELAAGAGEMVGGVGSMFAGGGVAAKALPKLVQAGKIANEARLAGKTAAETQAAYKKAAGASLMGGKLLDNAISGAVMVGGGDARENPDATLWSTTKAAIQGGVTMAPLAFVPHAKSVMGAIGWRAPTDAAILATANTFYDHFVNGKEINVTELRDQIGKDIPSFMLMNGIMAVFGRTPLMPSGAKKLQEAKTPQQVIDDPVAVHDVLNKAMDALVTPEPAAKEAEPVTETPYGAATAPVVASAEKASSPVVPDAGAGAAPVPVVTKRPLPGKTRKPAQPPVQAVEPVDAPMAQPVVEKPAAVAGGDPVKAPEPAPTPTAKPKASPDNLRKLRADVVKYNDLAYRARLPMGDVKDAARYEALATDASERLSAAEAKTSSAPTPAARKPPATDAEIAAGFKHTVTSSALKKASFQDLKHFAKIAKYPDGGTVADRAIGKSAIALLRALREHRETYEKFAGIKKREYTPERLAQMREQDRKMIQARREKQANDQAEYFINLKAEKDKKVFDAKIADGTLIPVGGSVEIKGEFGEVRTVDGMNVDKDSGKIIYHVMVDGEMKMIPEDQVVDLGKPSEVLNDTEFDFGYNEAGAEGTPRLVGNEGRDGGGETIQRRGEEVQAGTGASSEAAARPELKALEVQTPEQVAAENKAKAKRDHDAAEIARRAAAPLPAGQGDVGAGDLFGEGGVAPGELALSRIDTIEKPKTGMETINKRVEVKSPLANLSPEKQARAKELQDKLRKITMGRAPMGFDPEILTTSAELAKLYVEGGVKTFRQFATNVKADMGDAWDRVKLYVHSAWQAAGAEDATLDDISRSEAQRVITDIDTAKKTSFTGSEPVESPVTTIRSVIFSDASMQSKAYTLKKMAESDGITIKQMQEKVEAETVSIADEIVKAGKSPDDTFAKLRSLYDKQPNLSARTSTSIENQAYSTPAPLAFLASHMIDAKKAKSVYEATGGNGMLLIGLEKERVKVNELDHSRALTLKNAGYKDVSEFDASQWTPQGKFSAELMNPPFGPLENTANVNGYAIKRLDHLIAIRALDALENDGKAVLILGANREPGRIGQGADRTLLNYLHNNFHVVDHFEVNGDLYSKQGASWPVRVIVIDGKRSDVPDVPQDLAPKSVDRLDTWEQTYNRAMEVRHELEKRRDGLGSTGQRKSVVPSGTGAEPAAKPEPVSKPSGRSSRPIVGRSGRGRSEGTGKTPNGESPIRGSDDSAGGIPSEPRGKVEPVVGTGRTGTGVKGLEEGSGRGDQEPKSGDGTGSRKELPKRVDLSDVRGEDSLLGKKRNEGQNEYVPLSRSGKLETLVPSNLAQGTAESLASLRSRVGGDVDEWLRKELGYETKDDLYKSLAAEQVDGAAMAIDQISRGAAIIIGDETGIGKGRQAAAVMRWAKINDHIPVFFTKDPKLFTDLNRDIRDTQGSMKPFILGDFKKGTIVDDNNNKLFMPPRSADARRQEMQNIISNGMTSSGYDSVLLTYSQINAVRNQQQFLNDLAAKSGRKLVVIMDEAHEGSGSESMQGTYLRGGSIDRGKGSNRQTIQMPGLLKHENVAGTMYLSATYSKKPDNMPLYFRTALGKAAKSMPELVQAMEHGGVALQQAVSEALSKVGQLVRRERDFTGVNFTRKMVGVGREKELAAKVDGATELLRQIKGFSADVRDQIKAGAPGEVKSTAQTETQIDYTEFASISHNYVSQLLLATKVDDVVKEAVEAHKRGEKPVIALMNTMEAVHDDFAEQMGLKTGSRVNLMYRDLLKRALDRTLRYSEKDAQGNSSVHTFSAADVGLKGSYDAIIDAISAHEVDLPISPIDAIISGMRKEGIRVGEMTGRSSGINYDEGSNSSGIYEHRQKANKNELVNGFNNGDKYDALILNASGSTGLSIHASPAFKERPIKTRNMIIAQPHLDVNVVVQTLGRIKRTGMIPGGAIYTMPVLPLEAERRPAMVLERKMKSLNANTTASQEGSVKIDTADFMNKYGDDVIARYLAEESPDLQHEVGLYPDVNDKGEVKADKEDYAMVFTGRMALMPNEKQRQAYDDITKAYNDHVDYLKATDQYDLEIKTYGDWDGVQKSDDILVRGEDESSIFTASTKLQKWEIKDTRHVPTSVDMADEFARKSKDPASLKASLDEFETDIYKRIDDKISAFQDQVSAAKNELSEKGSTATEFETARLNTEVYKAEKSLLYFTGFRVQFDNTNTYLRSLGYNAGELVRVEDTKEGNEALGMVVDIQLPKQQDGFIKARPGNIVLTILTNQPGGRIRLPLSQLTAGRFKLERSYSQAEDVDVNKTGGRYERSVIVGNPIRAITAAGSRGRLVSFKARDGKSVSGLLMPMSWNPSDMVNDPRSDLVNGKAVHKWIKEYGTMITSGHASIKRPGWSGDRVNIYVPSAKATGADIYLNKELRELTGDFEKRGNKMVAIANVSDVQKIADIVSRITSKPFRPEFRGGTNDSLVERVQLINKDSVASQVRAARGSTGPGLSRPDFDAALAEETKGMKFAGENVTSGVSGEAPEWAKAADGQAAKAEVEDTGSKTGTPDKDVIRRLESGKKIRVYRAMQLIDGKLYPPMSAKVAGKLRNPSEIGRWEQSIEQPELAREGKFVLDKANKATVPARYNPYFHTSRSPLNDQFSSAYKRPNLVTVEVEIPESELTSGYKADGAKDKIGELSWHSGPVSSKLPASKARTVILSRYVKPIRIVPDSEVAGKIADILSGENIPVPENVITPSLKNELAKRGIAVQERQSARFYRSDSGQIRALTIGNRSHFFLDRYDSPDQLRQDIREEAMHRVVNELGGPAWQKAASQVYGGTRAAMIVAEIKRNYGFKPGTEAFNHELLAKMVRDGQQNAGAWRRTVDAVVSMLRDAGRRLGLDLNMNDAELRNLANGMLRAKERQMAGGGENKPTLSGRTETTQAAQTFRNQAVTPDHDRTYMQAVERGDLAEAQRMVDEAAKAAGWNTTKAYHYTNRQFTEFSHAASRAQNSKELKEWLNRTEDSGLSASKPAGFTTEYGKDYVFPNDTHFFFYGDTPNRETAGVKSFSREVQAYLAWKKPLDITKSISAEETAAIISHMQKTQNRKASPGMAGSRVSSKPVGGFTRARLEGITPEQLFEFMRQSNYSRDLTWKEMMDALGYDAIIFKGNSSGTSLLEPNRGRGDGKEYTVVAVVDGKQIKSADPVIRDDAGRVIPLSERFNPKSPDIRYARGEKQEDRPAVRALSAVSRSPGEYKHLISWTRTNHGDLYDTALSDHDNAARVLAGLAESAERPEGLSGMAGLAFQRFKTAMGKGSGEEALQGKAGAMADTPRQREIDASLSEKIDEPSSPAIPDAAPAVDGSTWRDVRRNEDPAYKSEREFLDDYRDNGFHEARESAEEFLKRRFCAGRS
jgi:hypothetical protein